MLLGSSWTGLSNQQLCFFLYIYKVVLHGPPLNLPHASWPLKAPLKPSSIHGPGITACDSGLLGGYSYERVTITTVPWLALPKRELTGASSNLNTGRASRWQNLVTIQAQWCWKWQHKVSPEEMTGPKTKHERRIKYQKWPVWIILF